MYVGDETDLRHAFGQRRAAVEPSADLPEARRRVRRLRRWAAAVGPVVLA